MENKNKNDIVTTNYIHEELCGVRSPIYHLDLLMLPIASFADAVYCEDEVLQSATEPDPHLV